MGEIKKQSINNSLLSYAGALLGFLLIYIQPHLISAADIGLIRLLLSFSWMVAVVMPFGIGSITLRFFPRIRNTENTHNGFFALITLVASIGAFIIAAVLFANKAFFTAYYSRSPEFPEYFTEALVFAYILSLISVYNIYSHSLFKTTFSVFLTDVFVKIGSLIVVVAYSYRWLDRDQFVLGYISIFLVQLILLVIYLFRHESVSLKINFSFYKSLNLREIVLFGLLMMITAFASLGIKYIDQLMVGHYLNAEKVGIYATCVMMCVIMEIPFNSLDRIASPKISHAWNISDVAEVEKIYEMSSRYMFFIGGVIFCLLWSGIDLIFYYLPAEYEQGKMAFYLISVSSLVNLLTGVNSSVILYSHKYFAASIFLFVLIVSSWFANTLFIEPMGISGAALATLIALSAYNLLKYIYILIRFRMQPFTRHTFYIFCCILITLGVILMLPAGINPFIKAAVGGTATALVFSGANIRFNSIGEVNKVFKRIGLLRNP